MTPFSVRFAADPLNNVRRAGWYCIIWRDIGLGGMYVYDFDGDHSVGILDLLILLGNWG